MEPQDSQQTVVIRALEEQDLPLLEVNEQMEATLRRFLPRTDWSERGVRAFVAELPSTDGSAPAIAGHALAGRGYPPYFPALDEGVEQLYVASLEVSEQFRRRGVATALLRFLVAEARGLKAQLVRAECEKGWRVDFYARVGLRPVSYAGPVDNYPDSHQMLELRL